MPFFGKKAKTAKIAKQRLWDVLALDRLNLSQDKLDELKREMFALLSRYVVIEESDFAFEIKLNNAQGERIGPTLHTATPIDGIRRDRAKTG